jgi:2'-5' RNA ligase
VRAFVAADIGPDVRAGLRPVLAELRRLGGPVRWVKEDNVHLTLKFLGDVEWLKIGKIAEVVKQAAALARPFTLRVAGLRAFPPGPSPRIVAAGLTAGVEELRALHKSLDGAMRQFGVPAENRDFLAHLTLGRVRARERADRLWEALARHADRDFGEAEVTELILFQSELKPQGAEYVRLATARLASGETTVSSL